MTQKGVLFLGLYQISSNFQNFQEEVENYDPTTHVSRGAECEDVVNPYDKKPLASYLSLSKSTI